MLRHCLEDLEIPMVLQEMHEGVGGGQGILEKQVHFSSNQLHH